MRQTTLWNPLKCHNCNIMESTEKNHTNSLFPVLVILDLWSLIFGPFSVVKIKSGGTLFQRIDIPAGFVGVSFDSKSRNLSSFFPISISVKTSKLSSYFSTFWSATDFCSGFCRLKKESSSINDFNKEVTQPLLTILNQEDLS